MSYSRSTRSSYKNKSLPDDCVVTLSDSKPSKQILQQVRNTAIDRLKEGKLANFSCSYEESDGKYINHQILCKNEPNYLLVCELNFYSLSEYKKLYPRNRITKDCLPQNMLTNGDFGADYRTTIRYISSSLNKPYKFFGDVDYEKHKICRDLTEGSTNPCSLYTRIVVDKGFLNKDCSNENENENGIVNNTDNEIENFNPDTQPTLLERLKRKYNQNFIDLTEF